MRTISLDIEARNGIGPMNGTTVSSRGVTRAAPSLRGVAGSEGAPPNKTTVYTASGERNSTPSLMQCKGNSGALKSIVFAEAKEGNLFFGGALQTGFQTHLFGNITTGPDGNTSVATSMAEAGMKAIGITPATTSDIAVIHKDCVNFPPVGPLP